ncbi:MAG: hypothetical protein HWD92_12030 [Flavobacteriia bacterium]|nr:hypothetical protein [Flavobacteriia bacterium]
MKRIATTFTLLLLAQLTWAQTRVDVSAVNYSEDPSGVISFDLAFECTRGDTAFIAFGDIVFTADWTQFTNPTLNVTWLGAGQSRSGNANLNPGFIRFGSQQNGGKVVYSLDPKFIDSMWQFNDNVLALPNGQQTSLVHIEVTNYTGILDPAFDWVITGQDNENTSNVHYFTNKQPKFVTEPAVLRFTDFPTLGSPRLDITVFLEGAYDVNTGEMRTDLNSQGLLPLKNPYEAGPWNYSGGDSVAAIPNADVVDWVLVEIRETNNATNANATSVIGTRAGFLLKNGHVVDLDGSSYLEFDNVTFDDTKNQYVVVHHRNHLAMMCSDGLMYNDSLPPIPRWECDMTSGLSTIFGGSNGAKVKNGFSMLIAGDGDHDGDIFNSDSDVAWFGDIGANGYYDADFDLDGNVFNSDREVIWYTNKGKSNAVPQ